MGTSVDRACRWSGWEVARGGTSQLASQISACAGGRVLSFAKMEMLRRNRLGWKLQCQSVLDVPGHEVEMSHGRGVGHRGDAQGGATVAA